MPGAPRQLQLCRRGGLTDSVAWAGLSLSNACHPGACCSLSLLLPHLQERVPDPETGHPPPTVLAQLPVHEEATVCRGKARLKIHVYFLLSLLAPGSLNTGAAESGAQGHLQSGVKGEGLKSRGRA